MDTKKKKIAVVITHRAPYGRLRPVLEAIQNHPKLELQIIVGSHVFLHHFLFALRHSDFKSLRKLLYWYFRTKLSIFKGGKSLNKDTEFLTKTIRGDGFRVDAQLPLFFEGGNLITMTKSVGVGILELPKIFNCLKPDTVLVHADRFEMLSVAVTAALMNIPIAHTQGGDISGTIDETIRHAITKLSHIHFPTTEKSKDRLIRMGEDPKYIFMTGCPTIDILKDINLEIDGDIYARNGNGFGDKIDFRKEPYLLVLQHPVTTEYNLSRANMEELILAIKEVNMSVLFLWPNIDAGSDGASQAVRQFIKNHGLPKLSLYKSFNNEDFYRVLNGAAVAIGNSSSFIREGSYLGTPAVLVGTRQNNRERGQNIIDVEYKKEEIVSAIRKQMKHGKYEKSCLYGDGNSAKRIADVLSSVTPVVQKSFYEN